MKTTKKLKHKYDSISNEDKMLKLAELSQDYLTGKITYEEYKNHESRYKTDYYQITLENNNIKHLFLEQLSKWSTLISRLWKKKPVC